MMQVMTTWKELGARVRAASLVLKLARAEYEEALAAFKEAWRLHFMVDTVVVPEAVLERLTRNLKLLQEAWDMILRNRKLDDRFGGNGRYEAEAWQARDEAYLAGVRAEIDSFRAAATAKSVDVEALIAERGGLAVLELSPRAAEWLGITSAK